MKDIRTQESYTRREITHGGTHTQSDTHGGIHMRRNTLIPPPWIIKLPNSFPTTLKAFVDCFPMSFRTRKQGSISSFYQFSGDSNFKHFLKAFADFFQCVSGLEIS